jgi:hypothetical protein
MEPNVCFNGGIPSGINDLTGTNGGNGGNRHMENG